MANSRPWKLTVRESLQEVQVADDSVTSRLEIPAILPPRQTGQILKRVLRERGFHDDGGVMVRDQPGAHVEIDPDTGGVTISARASQDIDIEGEGDLPACPPCATRAKEAVREALREHLRDEADDRQRDLQERVTRGLEAAVQELACELERVSNQVTSSALKAKARELGEIKSITQDEQTGAMTIVVEVA